MFSTLHETNFKVSVAITLSSAHAFNLDQSKILLSGKELITCGKWNFTSACLSSPGVAFTQSFFMKINTGGTVGCGAESMERDHKNNLTQHQNYDKILAMSKMKVLDHKSNVAII